MLKPIDYEKLENNNIYVNSKFNIFPYIIDEGRIILQENNKQQRCKFSSIQEIGEYYRIRKKEITLIIGIPGHGINKFINMIKAEIINNHAWRLASYPVLENSVVNYIYNIDGLIINPINIVYKKFIEQSSESKFFNSIRKFVNKNNIHLWMSAYPSIIRIGNSGNIKVPNAFDISGKNWFEMADNVISIYRNSNNNVEIHIQKIRLKERDRKKEIALRFGKRVQKYCGFKNKIFLVT